MFSALHLSEVQVKYDYGDVTKTVILALLIIFLSFVLLVFLVGAGYAFIIFVVHFLEMLCCSFCKRSSTKSNEPPPYNSLCKYYKHFYFAFAKLFIMHFAIVASPKFVYSQV